MCFCVATEQATKEVTTILPIPLTPSPLLSSPLLSSTDPDHVRQSLLLWTNRLTASYLYGVSFDSFSSLLGIPRGV